MSHLIETEEERAERERRQRAFLDSFPTVERHPFACPFGRFIPNAPPREEKHAEPITAHSR